MAEPTLTPDLTAVAEHVAAVENDDLANIPEDMADNIDAVCADVHLLVAEIERLRSDR
jgi:hypothetical protein